MNLSNNRLSKDIKIKIKKIIQWCLELSCSHFLFLLSASDIFLWASRNYNHFNTEPGLSWLTSNNTQITPPSLNMMLLMEERSSDFKQQL